MGEHSSSGASALLSASRRTALGAAAWAGSFPGSVVLAEARVIFVRRLPAATGLSAVMFLLRRVFCMASLEDGGVHLGIAL